MTIECCHGLEARLLSCDLGTERKSFSSAEAQHSPHRKAENRNCQAPITPDARECSRRPSVESDRGQADCSSTPTARSCDGSERSIAATQSMSEAAQKPDEEDEAHTFGKRRSLRNVPCKVCRLHKRRFLKASCPRQPAQVHKRAVSIVGHGSFLLTERCTSVPPDFQGLLNVLASSCRYREIYAMYKKAVASFWTVEEVDLSQDQRDWDRLSGLMQGCHQCLMHAFHTYPLQ